MQLGFIGAGNMATALAQGLGLPALFSDPVREKAEALAASVGGEAVADNRELAQRVDLVILCHKPQQLEAVAEEIAGDTKALVSLLAGRTLADLESAYGSTPTFRIMPNIAVSIKRGVICLAPPSNVSADLESKVRELFNEVATVIDFDERLLDVGTGVAGVGPAYVALIAEAWAEAAIKHGLTEGQAVELVNETLSGSLELLKAEGDTLALRRKVTSPGGVTARGIEQLESGGIRELFYQALAATSRTKL